MIIVFHPRDIELWRKDFSFSQERDESSYRKFNSYEEFVSFLQSNGIRTDDTIYPLTFIKTEDHPRYGDCYGVVQWTLIGWVNNYDQE